MGVLGANVRMASGYLESEFTHLELQHIQRTSKSERGNSEAFLPSLLINYTNITVNLVHLIHARTLSKK